ncbi:hypothetical protein CYMTET_38575 [Cymbomonas tetramitiformis]|uniref:Uncharacterized protein n=1 Tax=Cymbomonas tetramitiformis TaxID=36881 RepID=A0AAE0F5C2_9CHLO|nr:hypothetical protein CYMTET_38575 [Cymbomonas tetramitiformis]
MRLDRLCYCTVTAADALRRHIDETAAVHAVSAGTDMSAEGHDAVFPSASVAPVGGGIETVCPYMCRRSARVAGVTRDDVFTPSVHGFPGTSRRACMCSIEEPVAVPPRRMRVCGSAPLAFAGRRAVALAMLCACCGVAGVEAASLAGGVMLMWLAVDGATDFCVVAPHVPHDVRVHAVGILCRYCLHCGRLALSTHPCSSAEDLLAAAHRHSSEPVPLQPHPPMPADFDTDYFYGQELPRHDLSNTLRVGFEEDD